MAEDDFLATKSGSQFRGSRYPGFSSGTVSPTTGLGTSSTTGGAGSSSGLVGGGNNTSLAAQAFDIPEYTAPSMGAMAKDLGGLAAGAGATYAATKVGEGAGAAIAKGASLGSGISSGVSGFASDVGNSLGFGAGQKVYDSVASVGPTMAEFSGGAGVAGESLGAAAGSATSQGTSLASQSFGDKLGEGLTSGANIGAGVGAGLATTVIGLATGQKPEAALRSGVGAGAGYYAGAALGTAIGGPVGGAVGGFIGSTIGSIFCFAAGTPVLMEDGSTKSVELLRRGDMTALGGRVVARGEADAQALFAYKGAMAVGGHAVFEDGRWLRVAQSKHAVPVYGLDGQDVEVYPVATENMLLVTPWFIAADAEEVDNTAGAYTDEDRIDLLNGDTERNAWLSAMEQELCHGLLRDA